MFTYFYKQVEKRSDDFSRTLSYTEQMKKIAKAIHSQTKNLFHIFKHQNIPKKFLHKNVPYFSQWESPNMVKDILINNVYAGNDPKWKESGAKTKEEYAEWSANGCGMACTKMLLAYKTRKSLPQVTLGKKCAEYGGYELPIEKSKGLIYSPFVNFLHKEFNVLAKSVIPLTLHEITYELGRGNFVITSVSPHIRISDSKPKNKGGHLVLILGYDLNKRVLYFHNPSGFEKATREYATIDFKDFKKFFGNRGIIIY